MGSTALKLYDKKGNLIEQRTNTGLGIFKFTVEGLPVAKWRIEPVGDEPAGFAVDNVCFTLRALESPRLYPKSLLNGGTLESIPDTVPPTPPERFQSQDNDEDYVDEKTSDEDYLEEEANSQSNTNSTLAPLSNNVATLDPKRLDPKKVAQLSCDGIGTPLDKPKLDQIVKEAFPNASDEFIQDTFEATALASQDLVKYDERTFGRFPSPERAIRSKNTRRNVVPDAVSDPVIIDQAPFQYGPPIPIPYPLSTFWDAKVLQVDKGIRLSESRYQAQGFLDYLSHYSSAALAPVPKNKHPRGHLVYITTASTRGVSKGIQQYKGSTPGVPFTPVLVYHAVACIRNITEPTTDFIQIGRSILLNGDRSEFIGYPDLILNPLPAGRPTPLIFQ